jgi:hypothetical protein
MGGIRDPVPYLRYGIRKNLSLISEQYPGSATLIGDLHFFSSFFLVRPACFFFSFVCRTYRYSFLLNFSLSIVVFP